MLKMKYTGISFVNSTLKLSFLNMSYFHSVRPWNLHVNGFTELNQAKFKASQQGRLYGRRDLKKCDQVLIATQRYIVPNFNPFPNDKF